VKNEEKEEISILNVERSIPLLLVLTAFAVVDLYYAWGMLKSVNPWGFFVAIPGLIISFQLLFLFLHPFAVVYDDRFEITQSFVHKKQRYFTDIKKVSPKNTFYFYITYHDDEIEKIHLFGVRPSHLPKLNELLQEKIKTAPSASA
jgi:hypothetical protein